MSAVAGESKRTETHGIRASQVVALALIVGVFFTAQTVFMALTAGRPLRVEWDVLQELLYWVVWALLAPRVLALARRWPLDSKPIVRSVLRHALASAALAALQAFVAFALHLVALIAVGAVPASAAGHWMRGQSVSLVWGVFMGVFFYWVVIGVDTVFRFRGLYSAARVDAAEMAARSATLEGALASARLDALRSQLRPHFLFNTLNSIAVLAREDAAKAQRMVIRLGSLLRRSLDETEHEIPLRQELTFLDDYLDIQRVRFGDRLSVSIVVEPSAADARVPVLLLQPIVENAIEHGSPDTGAAATITLTAARVGNRLRLSVEDNGRGPGDAVGGHEGIDLRNTRERLERLYGAAALFRIGAGQFAMPEDACTMAGDEDVHRSGGTRVDIELPFAAAAI